MTDSVFSQFTNLYSLSKTLRFELMPVGKTADFLKANKVFEKDKTVDDSYNQAKFYFDELHREFISAALSLDKVVNFPCDEFAQAWQRYEKEKNEDKNKATDAWKKIQSEFRKKVVEYFRKEAKRWGNDGIKFLLSADALDLLKEKFPKENDADCVRDGKPSLFVEATESPGTKRYIFESFEKFMTYLRRFQKTRENLYADDGKNTAIATRVSNNSAIFLQNAAIFTKKHLPLGEELGLTAPERTAFETNNCKNLFLQDGIDAHNAIIGGLNRRMKELRDKHGKDSDFSKNNYPLLKTLEKQILGKVEKELQLIVSDGDVFTSLQDYITLNEERYTIVKNLMNDLIDGKFSKEELDGIYITGPAINTISRRWFSDGFSFERALTPKKDQKKEGDAVKVPPFVSLANIFQALDTLESESLFKEDFSEVINKQSPRAEQFLTVLRHEFRRCFAGDRFYTGYNKALEEARLLLKTFPVYKRTKKEIETIKNYADSALSIFQLMKYFSLETRNQADKPAAFSTEFYERYGQFRGDEAEKPFAVRYYNAFRNYLSKKPDDEGKLKINFDSGQLLSGWDKNKEKEKLGIVLRKDGVYYLGIINKNNNSIFDGEKYPEAYVASDSSYEKMEYKLFPDPKRMIPKIAFAEKNKQALDWTQQIQDIKDEYVRFQKEKKDNKELWKNQFDKGKTSRLIAYYQHSLIVEGYKATFNFFWKRPEDYHGIGEFNDDVARQNYRLRFIPVDKQYIDRTVEKGELFLFQIHSKDIANAVKGRKNIHTTYFLQLFSSDNLNMLPPVIQLAGNAEIFYREAVLKPETEKRKFSRPIIKYKRYTEPKILFYVPISINSGVETIRNQDQFNKDINKRLIVPQHDRLAIIGIDRGEKHLAYYSVVNQKGEILDQGSLNKINGVNYFELLCAREKERLENRRSWQSLRQIKDLKRGYISQVVRKIADLVIQYNAIVVLEDLNMRFKQVRGGIERSVYQQLEKALIEKFSYLVFKDRSAGTPGGVLNGYQLAAPFESFEKMGKQTGIIFYTQAGYTSRTDPLTGFRKNVYISNSLPVGETRNENKQTLKTVFVKFKSIGWDDAYQSYFFEYDEKNFVSMNLSNGKKNKEEAESCVRKVYANVPRIKREKHPATGYWTYQSVNPNTLLEELFRVWGFEQLRGDMLEQVWEMDADGKLSGEKMFEGKPHNFYKSLVYILNLILEIRNSYSKKLVYEKDTAGKPIEDADGKLKVREEGEDVDFIASPVYPFFRTKIEGKTFAAKPELAGFLQPNFAGFEKRVVGAEKQRILDEFNGDANGAYNIARKGIMILQRIRDHAKIDPEFISRVDLFIGNRDWDGYVSSGRKT